jgi:hypothetical protein
MNLRAAVKGHATTDKDIIARLRKEKVYIAAGTAYVAEEEGVVPNGVCPSAQCAGAGTE